jgi:catechol 2,3-dioxygenase-like lactoylglutathione lyase family enzyme
MFDHVQIKVADLESCRQFYIEVLATLGYEVVLDEEVVVGIGVDVHNMFEVSQARDGAPLSNSVHIAFVAKDTDAVRRFHTTAIRLGAKDNGKPDYRPIYGEGYFAAFVTGPNGHNLEAVFWEKRE